MKSLRPALRLAGLTLALAAGLPASLAAKDFAKVAASPAAAAEQAARLDAVDDAELARQLDALAPQRPGHRDLYVLGFAGDGSERVFRNEVLHLRDLAAQRLDAAGRVLVLANHPPDPVERPLPAANLDTLRRALAGIGARMDPDEDLLLLYLTTHGTPEHELLLRRPEQQDHLLRPGPLRAALDDAGIRHRVLVISACYSGGFVRELRDPGTLLLTAARRDRPSFGCGNDSVATYFGRAWLVDGLNRTVDFIQAFEQARLDIEAREMAEGLTPSQPQINRGERIGAVLSEWREGFQPGPALPYPHAEPEEALGEAGASPAPLTPLRPPADRSSSR